MTFLIHLARYYQTIKTNLMPKLAVLKSQLEITRVTKLTPLEYKKQKN